MQKPALCGARRTGEIDLMARSHHHKLASSPRRASGWRASGRSKHLCLLGQSTNHPSRINDLARSCGCAYADANFVIPKRIEGPNLASELPLMPAPSAAQYFNQP